MVQTWTNWESGDALAAPSDTMPLQVPELLSKLAASFSRIIVDWHEGDKWIEARIVKAISNGYPPRLVEAEKSLLGRTALVSVSDPLDPTSATVSFFALPDTGLIELHYEPPGAEVQCRTLALRLAEKIGYEFDSPQS